MNIWGKLRDFGKKSVKFSKPLAFTEEELRYIRDLADTEINKIGTMLDSFDEDIAPDSMGHGMEVLGEVVVKCDLMIGTESFQLKE